MYVNVYAYFVFFNLSSSRCLEQRNEDLRSRQLAVAMIISKTHLSILSAPCSRLSLLHHCPCVLRRPAQKSTGRTSELSFTQQHLVLLLICPSQRCCPPRIFLHPTPSECGRDQFSAKFVFNTSQMGDIEEDPLDRSTRQATTVGVCTADNKGFIRHRRSVAEWFNWQRSTLKGPMTSGGSSGHSAL